jgi:hypothetical protein
MPICIKLRMVEVEEAYMIDENKPCLMVVLPQMLWKWYNGEASKISTRKEINY